MTDSEFTNLCIVCHNSLPIEVMWTQSDHKCFVLASVGAVCAISALTLLVGCYSIQSVKKSVKDHRQRIPRFVIRRYLEKSIQKKLFAISNHYK